MLAPSHAIGMETFGSRRNDIHCRISWNTFPQLALSDGNHRHQTGRLWQEELPHSVVAGVIRLSRGDRAETR
jgi:hypothetical protein